MKLNPKTMKALEYAQKISPSLLLQKGHSSIVTISQTGMLLCEFLETDNFPVNAGIYDVAQFRHAIKIFKDPDFDFQEDRVIVSGEEGSISYHYCDPSNIANADNLRKSLAIKRELTTTCYLTTEDLKSVGSMAGLLGIDNIALIGDGKHIYLRVSKKNVGSHSFEKNIADSSVKFKTFIDKECLCSLPSMSYKVDIYHGGVLAEFHNENVRFFIKALIGSTKS